MSLDAILKQPNFRDWVYDPQRDLIHIVTGDGLLWDWDVGLQRYAGAYAVGGSPGSVDISPDGAFLWIGDSARTTTAQGPPATYADQLTRVNLATHGITQTFVPITYDYEGAIGDVAVGSDGRPLITTLFLGSGRTPLREFSPDAQTFTRLTGFGTFNELAANQGHASALLVSEDRRYVLVEEVNTSDGPLYVYDTLTRQIIGQTDTYRLASGGYQNGMGDISSAAGLVVDLLYNNVFVLDLGLRLVKDLTGEQHIGRIVGAAFGDGGHHLFLWQGADKQVVVLETAHWTQVATLQVSTATGAGYVGALYGAMDVASQGRVLILDTGPGLELIDLSDKLRITYAGDARDEQIFGEAGSDTLSGGGGTNYLRGMDGNDSIVGGAGFDDINGNQGNDTCVSGGGDDWVVGGKDNDSLVGSDGKNLVYGNLGADTCDGGAGDDIVRGGQDDDVVIGGDGDDFVSGDKGSDTMTGGAGADIFHTFGDAGVDRVTDFHLSEGDRVMLDPGTQYTVSQVGADTVINMTGGGQMILVGVQMSTLTPGWIFGA